ncbi:TRAP transporter substrate-binding protein, partial [Bacillus paralicheniformis]
SYSEHAIVPDILIMNVDKKDQLGEEQQHAVIEAAKESTEYDKIVWAEETENAVKKSKAMGVKFHKPDKTPFREAVSPLHDEFANQELIGKYYRKIVRTLKK